MFAAHGWAGMGRRGAPVSCDCVCENQSACDESHGPDGSPAGPWPRAGRCRWPGPVPAGPPRMLWHLSARPCRHLVRTGLPRHPCSGGVLKSAGRRGLVTGTKEALARSPRGLAGAIGPALRAACHRPGGRFASAGPGAGLSWCLDTPVYRAPCRAGGETRVAFPGPARRGNPFPRIGKSFPAGRWSDCSFGTLEVPARPGRQGDPSRACQNTAI